MFTCTREHLGSSRAVFGRYAELRPHLHNVSVALTMEVLQQIEVSLDDSGADSSITINGSSVECCIVSANPAKRQKRLQKIRILRHPKDINLCIGLSDEEQHRLMHFKPPRVLLIIPICLFPPGVESIVRDMHMPETVGRTGNLWQAFAQRCFPNTCAQLNMNMDLFWRNPKSQSPRA